MSTKNDHPFKRDALLDKPGIVGARWWQETLVHSDPIARRSALKALFLVGGTLASAALIGVAVETCASSAPDVKTEPRSSLDMQKEYGWNFGATADSLTFDGVQTRPFDRDALARMADQLAPTSPTLRRYYVPTLFQSPTALPRSVPEGDPGTVKPLKDALSPIFTSAMDVAYRRGQALASLFALAATGAVGGAHGAAAAVVIDLPGQEAVAFAAGAASAFDPVFAFDNWPHPRGVVPAHLTLAAAAYYQPLFAQRQMAPNAPPMFVLDRQRLAAYTDATNQFDNRHLSKLPSASDLRALGAKHVLYVVPTDSDVLELDDLNDDFVAFDRAGLGVRIVAASAFGPDPGVDSSGSVSRTESGGDAGVKRAAGANAKVDAGSARAGATDTSGMPPVIGPPYYYGSSADTHAWFWTDYPWVSPTPPAKRSPLMSNAGKSYVPRVRTTPFTPSGGGPKAPPPGFGTVPVVIALGTGVILGAALSRNGSWNRSSGGWGG